MSSIGATGILIWGGNSSGIWKSLPIVIVREGGRSSKRLTYRDKFDGWDCLDARSRGDDGVEFAAAAMGYRIDYEQK